MSAGCAAGGGEQPRDRRAVPPTELSVAIRARPGAPAQVYQLECRPPRGSHPATSEACAVAERVSPAAFAPVRPDAVCAEIYGGAQVAHVEGVLRGAPVEADFARTDGCEIERWDRLRPLIPLPEREQP
jgi:hypothetical protein